MRYLTLTMLAAIGLAGAAHGQSSDSVRTGAAAFGDWRQDAPGVQRLIRPADMPAPHATPTASAGPRRVARPDGAKLAAPDGFRVTQFANGLSGPRTLRFAPNGDLFVAETGADRVAMFRAAGKGEAARPVVFATGLDGVFGLAFHPANNPRWLYVATTTRVLRFPYAAGDSIAREKAATIVDGLPAGGHSTRDILFSRDGSTMYVSVGSQGNAGQDIGAPPADMASFEKANGVGAAWGDERGRADVFAFDPDGRARRPFATGLRNCVAMALRPASDDVWCAVNERDALGDDLPPDYVTHVLPGAFYGWPWFYIGANRDPRHPAARPDLAARVTVPDVLLQPHSAPLGMVFYEGDRFPTAYRRDAFVALHGSWNRAKRTGYKIVRARMKDGAATGVYEDFVTGFVASDAGVWGRPVSVTTGPDGALWFSDDAGGAIWRVAYAGE